MTLSERPRILITGVGGFVGHHLVSHLQSQKTSDLWGTSRQKEAPPNWPADVHHLQTDLKDSVQTQQMLEICRPHEIYHLAGQASVARSWKQPEETYTSNIHGQLHLFEALLHLKLQPKILLVGSSDEYGALEPSELPVREINPLRPLSPYAISKVAQDLMGFQYFRASKLPIVRTRTFNHTGPGRPDTYAISGFASQIARMELGIQPPVLHVGDLSIQRDYLDVRDVVKAYVIGLFKGIPGEVYNISSGRSLRLQHIVDLMTEHSTVKIRISKDSDRIRPADFPVIYGDSTKFQQLTGWKPEIPIEQTIRDLLAYWKEFWSRKENSVSQAV